MKTKKYTRFKDIPTFTSWGNYQINVPWTSVERTLQSFAEGYGLDLDPDFQRAHVWTEEKQIAYVEFILRGGRTSREILFNSPGWQGPGKEGQMVLVDGKQRLEAVRRFMNNEIKAFGSFYKEFTDKLREVIVDFVFRVNSLQTREEVLKLYLEINSGGVVHTDEEIARVRDLLEKEMKTSVSSF